MNPTVCCICLTADRPEMTNQAVQCFRAQTYPHAWLLVYNTGDSDEIECGCNPECFHVKVACRGLTIGTLRNLANDFKSPYHQPSDIIVTWDSDDWSHPNRITEQVALLQASGADCVGYNEMLFWREAGTSGPVDVDPMERTMPVISKPGEAWLYTNHRPNFALGTSLCYWRKTWEAKPFEDIPRPGDMEGEDGRFIRGLKVCARTSLRNYPAQDFDAPRMVARIHGGNSSDQYRDIAKSDNWKRVPEWDARLREVMCQSTK
jgi:glycosyltransferase involved in cell wall biosynthesis